MNIPQEQRLCKVCISNIEDEYHFVLQCNAYNDMRNLYIPKKFKMNPNIKSEMKSFKSNENIHKKEGGSYYVVSANKASSVTL